MHAPRKGGGGYSYKNGTGILVILFRSVNYINFGII